MKDYLNLKELNLNKLEIKDAINTKDKKKLDLVRKHYEKDYEEYMKQQESKKNEKINSL